MTLFRQTKKLYQGKYQYKAVLVCSGVHLFRTGDLDTIFKKLSLAHVPLHSNLPNRPYSYGYPVQTQQDLDYLFALYELLSTFSDFAVRVENPWLSVYSTNEEDIEKILSLDKDRVRMVYKPFVNLKEGEVISSLPFDYKVFINNHKPRDTEGFLNWAKDNKNLRIPNSTKIVLLNQMTYPPTTYFYVLGEKNLTLTKIYLGGLINRVEKLIRVDT